MLTSSELGLATHYVPPEELDNIVLQLQNIEKPTLETISTIIASYAPPLAPSTPLSSKKSPDGPTVIKGEIREFLDNTFKLPSIAEVYKALEAAETDSSLSEEVKAWAKEQKGYMDVRSPTGMAIALETVKRARQAKRLDQTLQDGMSSFLHY